MLVGTVVWQVDFARVAGEISEAVLTPTLLDVESAGLTCLQTSTA